MSPNVEVELVRHLSDKELDDIARRQFDIEMQEYDEGHDKEEAVESDHRKQNIKSKIIREKSKAEPVSGKGKLEEENKRLNVSSEDEKLLWEEKVISPSKAGLKDYNYSRSKQKISTEDFSDE